MKKILFILETDGASGQDNNRALVYAERLLGAGVKPVYRGYEPQHGAWALNPPTRFLEKLASSIEYRVYAWFKFKIVRFINTCRILLIAPSADTIFLIKASSLKLVETIRRISKARLVYDLGDALWLPTYAGTYRQLPDILKLVDAVTCDNALGADYARGYCKETHVWTPYPQIESFDKKRKPKPSTQGKPVVIGWVGSPGTLYNLYAIWEALEDLFSKHSHIRLDILGCGTQTGFLPPFERVRYRAVPSYTNDEMFGQVLDMDIGIFPMFDVENSKVRGIMKALIYMSGEAAVVSSPRVLCQQLITDGENGYLAEGRSEWVDKLNRLILNPAERTRLTSNALQVIRQKYSMDQCFREMREYLHF